MGLEAFRNALASTNEVELGVTGRKSGREGSRPLWFVEEGEAYYPQQDAAVELQLT